MNGLLAKEKNIILTTHHKFHRAMGIASKWIRNLLLVGKKDEKDKKNLKGSSDDYVENLVAILPETPKEKPRWSFRRSSTSAAAASEPNNNCLKISTSFDSSIYTKKQLTKVASLKCQNNNRQIPSTTVPAAAAAAAELVANIAATKIQSFFRCYLARRALIALRGLVKLQALVKGHLVRKRTTATMRCMHALITIQVRARVQRIQMAKEDEEELLVLKRQNTSREQLHQVLNRQQKRAHCDEKKTVEFFDETQAEMKSTTDYKKSKLNSSFFHKSFRNLEIETRGDNNNNNKSTHSSRNFSVLIRDQFLPASPSNSSRSQNCPFQDHPSTTSHTIPPHYQMEAPNQMSHDYPWLPNYMTNTESSRGKLRSHSEPKQRPKTNDKQTRRSTSSCQEIDTALDDVRLLGRFSNVRSNTQKNQWLNKLCQPTRKFIKDKTGNSNNSEDLVPYEPPVNLY